MQAYLFRSEQYIPQPISKVFEFFSQAENLQKLTPEWLHFRILSVAPKPVGTGTLIRYALRWRIFPIRWTTEIAFWQPPYRFVDVQLSGPYKLWRHEHRFVAEAGGTRIIDEIQYSLPLGVLGRLAHKVKVKQDVENIFAHRVKAVRNIFGDEGKALARSG